MSPPALQIKALTKQFGGALALDHVDLEVEAGEVHALLGQNGSGKSTLVKIITGYHTPDSYTGMRMWDSEIRLPIRDPGDLGIAVIHQDLGLVSGVSVADNIGISSGFGTKSLLPIRFGSERRRSAQALRSVGVELPLDSDVGTLSPSERAGVALARSARRLEEHGRRQLFVLDEPTSSLTGPEAERLIEFVLSVARRGTSVIFISHRLGEVLDVADRITVLRDGRVVTTTTPAEATKESLVAVMLGREFESFYPDRDAVSPGELLLEVEGLYGRLVSGLDLEARAGELIGIAGLAGMGSEELPYLLGGVLAARGGTVRVAGEPTLGLGPSELTARGVVLVPGDRLRDGGWLEASAQENITLPVLKQFFSAGTLRLSAERQRSQELMGQFGVRPPNPTHSLRSFSGGNQQKIVLAKWLSMQPRVLLLHEPTQGVDAGAKRDILELVVQAVRRGSTALLCSGDYEQMAHVCSRVLVLRHGTVAATLVGDQITEQNIAVSAQKD